jgi:ParB family chromosome partitioning protein
MSKARPNVANFLSGSNRALQTQQELADAKEQIAELEKEIEVERQQIQSVLSGQKVSQASVSIAQILRRPYQSRREKDSQAFESLVQSIKLYGFRGAIWVQRLSNGQLRLIAGETRLDAAIEVGLTEIVVDIVETDDITAVKLSRMENVRRRNLNALDDTEEILYLLTLVLKQQRDKVISLLYKFKNATEGKSSLDPEIQGKIESVFQEVAPELGVMTFVTSRLPLLKLPNDVLEAYSAGKLQYTKAVELGRVGDEALRQELLSETIEQELSLAELKARIRPTTSPRTVTDRMEKIRGQIKSINQKSVSKLSKEEQQQLKKTIEDLEILLQEKRKELEWDSP